MHDVGGLLAVIVERDPAQLEGPRSRESQDERRTRPHDAGQRSAVLGGFRTEDPDIPDQIQRRLEHVISRPQEDRGARGGLLGRLRQAVEVAAAVQVHAEGPRTGSLELHPFFERAPQLPRAGPPASGVPLQAPQDRLAQPRWHPLDRRQLLVLHLVPDLVCRPPEQRAAGQQFVQGRPQAPQVLPRRGIFTEDLLEGAVRHRPPGRLPSPLRHRAADLVREVEVGELRPPVGAQHEVGRLDVPVEHRVAQPVRVLQAAAEVDRDLRDILGRQAFGVIPEQGGPRRSIQVLEDQVGRIAVGPRVPQANDLRVVQLCRQPGLPLEGAAMLRVRAELRAQHLHRPAAPEALPILSQEDDAERPVRDEADQLVPASQHGADVDPTRPRRDEVEQLQLQPLPLAADGNRFPGRCVAHLDRDRGPRRCLVDPPDVELLPARACGGDRYLRPALPAVIGAAGVPEPDRDLDRRGARPPRADLELHGGFLRGRQGADLDLELAVGVEQTSAVGQARCDDAEAGRSRREQPELEQEVLALARRPPDAPAGSDRAQGHPALGAARRQPRIDRPTAAHARPCGRPVR